MYSLLSYGDTVARMVIVTFKGDGHGDKGAHNEIIFALSIGMQCTSQNT